MTDLLRHALATLAYRAGKTLRETPPGFATFAGGPGLRTPLQLIGHLGDLMAWSTSIVRGAEGWVDTTPATWEASVERFYHELKGFDSTLGSVPEPHPLSTRLLQGPVADALTHVGQLAMLRRMAGAPIKGENYFRAEIAIGRLGTDQSAPRREF